MQAVRGAVQPEPLARGDPHVSRGPDRLRLLVAGVYAVAWLRGRRDAYHRAGLVVPLAVPALAAPAQLIVGDWAARTVAEEQPTKLAAFEGLDHTTDGAGLTVGGIYVNGKVYGGIEIPDMLSLLAFHDPNAKVRGARRSPARRSSARRNRPQHFPADGRDRHAPGRSRGLVPLVSLAAGRPAADALVLPRRRGRRARPRWSP